MKEITRAYAAGVVDAEGCLAIAKSNDPRGPIYSARVVVSNRAKELTSYFSHHFGGYTTVSKPRKENHNINYLWHLSSGQHTERFLSQIYPHLRYKKEQADILFEYLHMGRTPDPEKREELYQRSKILKQLVRVTTETPTSSNLDHAYLAGFFDGEGSVSIINFEGHGHRQFASRLNVTNTDLPTLELYKKIYGGSIRKHSKPRMQTYRWELRKNEDRQHFLLSVLPYLIVKKEEASIVLDFLRLGNSINPEGRANLYNQIVHIKAQRMIQSQLYSDVQSAPTETLTA